MRAIRYNAAGGVVIATQADPVAGDRQSAPGERCSPEPGEPGRLFRRPHRVLVLRRPSRGEVRLPKGHVEKGESSQEAALREVAEESGYADLEILSDLGHQTVEFDYKGVHVVRDERYFLMHLRSHRQIERHAGEHVRGESQFIPDWLNWDQALSELTFEAEREWVRRARRNAPLGSSS
jgi:8-oxo-dGTP pyrophosphatase MutT (NUDIX family)